MIKNFSNRPKFIKGDETPLMPKMVRYYGPELSGGPMNGYADYPLYNKVPLTRRQRQKKAIERELFEILSEEIQDAINYDVIQKICEIARIDGDTREETE